MESRDVVIVGLMFLVIILFSSMFYIVFLENDDIESDPINNTTNEEVNTSIQEIEEVQVPKAEQPSSYGNVAVDYVEARSYLAHTPDYASREMFSTCDENGGGLLTCQEYDDWRYMVANSEFARNAHNH